MGLFGFSAWACAPRPPLASQLNGLLIALESVRPDTSTVRDLETTFRDAPPDRASLPQHFSARGCHAGRSRVRAQSRQAVQMKSEMPAYPALPE